MVYVYKLKGTLKKALFNGTTHRLKERNVLNLLNSSLNLLFLIFSLSVNSNWIFLSVCTYQDVLLRDFIPKLIIHTVARQLLHSSASVVLSLAVVGGRGLE